MTVEFLNPEGLSHGTYSHTAIVTGGRLVYVSGQVAFDEAGKVVGTTFAEQADRVFHNLRIALAAGSAQFGDIVKLNVYVRDLTSEKVRCFREIRSRHLGGHQPASTLVATPALVHEDLMLEVEAISAGSPIYIIDPAKCTECVGAHDEQQCIDVCPADCILPDPDHAESREQLEAKYHRLHG